MKQQTAVDFLIEQITDSTMPVRQAIKQAKEMEKKQIMNAFEEGMFHHTNGLCPDEYYEETFKSE